eukprot:gnl/TRDRNA2_/TRDRNA2_40822_c0_seq1.p1 gnl/TRDRNA2_/TRDRNA2_40822_c0~~gnl/TRDRNA2_/TRDRNA2_40822_c0_seq1.p1  ORF type:complete len:267 (-),score=63.78 gnl/TRDRNA2_/TRDRNA2_40822_c0_seq1:10-810(-)
MVSSTLAATLFAFAAQAYTKDLPRQQKGAGHSINDRCVYKKVTKLSDRLAEAQLPRRTDLENTIFQKAALSRLRGSLQCQAPTSRAASFRLLGSRQRQEMFDSLLPGLDEDDDDDEDETDEKPAREDDDYEALKRVGYEDRVTRRKEESESVDDYRMAFLGQEQFERQRTEDWQAEEESTMWTDLNQREDQLTNLKRRMDVTRAPAGRGKGSGKGGGKSGSKGSGKDKMTLKDRTRLKRLKGQSASDKLGSHWKSEAEMRLRDNYD